MTSMKKRIRRTNGNHPHRQTGRPRHSCESA